MIIHVPLLLNFAGACSSLACRDMPLASSGKLVSSQLNYGGIDLLGWRPVHHITDLGCLLSGLAVISDMDASMRSLGGRTVPDGAVGILTAFFL